jgi:hypothetical protein
MKYLSRLAFLFLLVVLGLWAWHLLFPNPRTVIHNRLNRLARLASFSAREGNFGRVAAIERMRGFFANNVEVVVEIPGTETHTFNNRDELMQAALAARSSTSSIAAKFIDIKIELSRGDQSAIVDLTLQASVSGDSDAVVQELRFTLNEIDGDWLITRIETVKTLKL